MSQYTAALQQLYVAYFNRPADAAGLQFWEGQMQNAQSSLADIGHSFASSTEYQTSFPDMSNSQIINQVYLNLFGRSAEAGGLAYWAEKMDNGSIHLNDLVTILATSAVGSDMDTVQAKVEAATMFTESITSEEQLAAYSGTAANLLAKEFLSTFVAPHKLHINQAEISQFWESFFIALPQAPGQQQGEEVSLTLAADSLTMGANMDHIIASTIDGQHSLSGLDNLDGGAGTDILAISSTLAETYTFPNQAKISNIELLNITTAAAANITLPTDSNYHKLSLNAHGAVEVNVPVGTSINLDTTVSGEDIVLVNGGKNLNVVVHGTSNGAIEIGTTVPATGNTFVKVFSDLNNGPITVVGGENIGVAQISEHPDSLIIANAAVTVTGTAETSRVSATAPVPDFGNVVNGTPTNGVYNAKNVSINDVYAADASKEGTIHEAWVDGFNSFNFNGNGLDHLTLINGAGDITIANAASNPAHTTLNLHLNSVFGGVLDDGDLYSTLNINTGSGASFLSNITDSALQTLNLSGMQQLSLTKTDGMSALKQIKVTDQAGLVASFVDGANMTVDTSASTGRSVLSFDRIDVNYSGGAGADVLDLQNGTFNIRTGTGADELKIAAPSLISENRVTLLDAHAGVKLTLPDMGVETFQVTGVVLPSDASKADYINAVVHGLGNAAENAAMGWFQFEGNTYLVESRHDASGTTGGYEHSVDMLIEMTGLVDLSKAHLDGNSLILG